MMNKLRKSISSNKFLSIRWKLILPLGLSVIFLSITLSPLINQLVERRIEQEADRRLVEIANSVNVLIENSTTLAGNIATLISSHPETYQYFQNPSYDPLEFISEQKVKLNLQEISFYSNQFTSGDSALVYGGPTVTRQLQVSESVDQIRSSLIQQAVQTGTSVTGIAISPQSSQIIGISPVFDPENDELIGVVFVAFFMNEDYIAEMSHVVGSDVAIVKNNAVIVSTIDPNSHYQELINNGWLELDYPAATISYSDEMEYRLIAQKFFSHNVEQGFVFVAQPIGELYAIRNSIQSILLGIVLVTSLTALLFWVIAFFSFTKPLFELTKATSLIEQGQFSQTVKVSYWGFKDEITRLSENFNKMSYELLGLYNNLEERVNERTFALITEITERKRVENALRESEERFILAVQGANDGLWDWNLSTNEVYYSPRWKSMLGIKEDEVCNSIEDWTNRIHTEDKEHVLENIKHHQMGISPHFECEYRIQQSNGKYIWVLSRGLAICDAEGKAYRMAGSQTDINARKQAENALAYNALHDPLTGLPNRVLLLDRIAQAFSYSKRQAEKKLALLFIDLDRFKAVNDSLGHAMGDQLLTDVAQTLLNCIRPNDTVSRLSGDEFAILIDGWSDENDVLQIAKRIHINLMRMTLPNAFNRPASASIGIAYYKGNYNNPEELIRDADIAMYRAKSLGGSQYQIFDTFMHKRLMDQLQTETELRQAIENEEFKIHYQPVIEMASGKIVGVEALIRWNHPTKGLLTPQHFIDIAEDTGLIKFIDAFVLKESTKQLKLWKLNGIEDMWVSINISGKQFQDEQFVSQVSAAILENNLTGNEVCLEITENIAMENPSFSSKIFNKLDSLGVQIGVDDFGIGYSSFGHLKSLPFSLLKIDRSFVQDIASSHNSQAIINAIIAMSHSLNMKVVAEGVMSLEQIQLLKKLGCDTVQGFYYSPGVPAEEIIKIYNSLKSEKTFYANGDLK